MPTVRHGDVVGHAEEGDKYQIKKGGRRSKNSTSSQKGNPSSSPIKNLDPESEQTPCNKCKKNFSSETNELGIQCDKCNAWYHLKCTNLSPKQFKFLDESPHNEFMWFCADCQGKTDPGMAFAQQTVKLEALTQIVYALQQQNTMILELLKRDRGNDEQIKTHVLEVMTNQLEKEDLKNNLMLWNLPEGPMGDADQDMVNEKEDLGKVREILTSVNPRVDLTKLDLTRVKRAGTRRKDRTTPRPVKITLDSPECKDKILRNAKTLKNITKFPKLGLSQDKTKKEREEYRQLRDKRDDLKKSTGEDWVIFRNDVVKRDAIPEILKKGREPDGAGSNSASNNNA